MSFSDLVLDDSYVFFLILVIARNNILQHVPYWAVSVP